LVGRRPLEETPEFGPYVRRMRELGQRYDALNAQGAFRSAPTAPGGKDIGGGFRVLD
jgi:hypothetical protein